jgi:hypothetical protein
MARKDAPRRNQAPGGLQLSLLVTTAFFTAWGALLALRGGILVAGTTGLSASGLPFAVALITAGIVTASLLAIVGQAVRGLRAGRLLAPLATQLTLGGMLTLVMLSASVNSDHAAEIRRVYQVVPWTTLLTAYAVIAAFTALSFRLLTHPSGPTVAGAVLGLAAAGGLAAAAGVLLAVLPATFEHADLHSVLQWGAAAPLAILGTEVVFCVHTARALEPTR